MSGSVTEAAASSAQEEEEEEGTDAWEDWQADGAEDGDEEATSSLFDSTVLPSVEAALEYDSEKHGLDLRKLRVEVCSGFRQILLCLTVRHRADTGSKQKQKPQPATL